jgi:tRNA-specific 2-thiouridylase
MALHPGVVVDRDGTKVGEVQAVELVTIGQRKGLGVGGSAARSYAAEVDVSARRVVVDTKEAIRTKSVAIGAPTWVCEPLAAGTSVLVQSSAHGEVFAAAFSGDSLLCGEPQRPVAAGQTVAFYDDRDPEVVLGSAIAA